jgi:asparagine synthase (glutamine-hydrolysing)
MMRRSIVLLRRRRQEEDAFMSAIFGLVYLDGGPVQPDRIDAMRRVMAGWGPDGMEVRISGCAALAHAHLCTTPEGRYERMPYVNPESGILMVAAARLDNRDELCDLFCIPVPERYTFPDGRLVSLVFERFGEDAPKHLFGDWSFAAWDEKRRCLFAARDHLGNMGMFYCHRPPVFAFASTPKAILALPEFHTRLDECHLARYLAVFPGNEDNWSHTFWEGVRLLLPAHSLSVTPKTIQLSRYWSLREVSRIRLLSDEEYLEGFLDHFRRAVKVRLRSNRPIGSQLSAGLDSGSVTALASEALRDTGQTLTSFTSVPLYPSAHLVPGALADEWAIARTVAKKYSNIEHIPIRAEDISPLGAIRDSLDIFGCPLHAAVNLYWIHAIHQEAQNRGIKVLLTGQLGNGGFSWSGGSNRIYFDLVQGRFGEGIQALCAYKAKQELSWYRTVRRQLLGPLFGPLWRRRRRLLHPTEPPWKEYSAVSPDFASRIALRKVMREENHDPAFASLHSPEWEHRRIIEINAPGGYIHHHLGGAFQMDVRDPTADVRLLMFCFGIPEEQYVRDGGERMVARRATAGILSGEVRGNTIRGKQAADVGLRLLNHKDEMEEELRSLASHGTVISYIDVNALQRAWQSILTEVTPETNRRAASLLLRGVMAGRFVMGLSN